MERALSPIAALAHDLRSPLAAVLGFARLAREDLAQGDLARAALLLERIERSAGTLEAILGSALDAGRGRSRTHARPVIEQIRAERKPELERRGVRLEAHCDAPPLAVRHADLYRLLSNLVGNALDHMGDACDPSIVVSIHSDGELATLCVRDNGVGIPPEERERVFEAEHSSWRGDAAAPRGLGLAIVRQLAATWGGRAWVAGTTAAGATLCVTLPVAR